MKAHRVRRDEASADRVTGRVLAREVRASDGSVAFAKGSIVAPDRAAALLALSWDELHLIEPEPGELLEEEASMRIARAAAGEGIAVGSMAGGQVPLASTRRGIVRVDVERLARANGIEGACVYTVYDGQIAEPGETVARAKITPFVLETSRVEAVERIARNVAGLVRVDAFRPMRIAAVVQESLGERAMARFTAALGEKVSWFGSTLLTPAFVRPDESAVADALQSAIAEGAEVVIMAGTKAMDPLDPAFLALARVGATLERHGAPAHPGSLFWIARSGEVPILGMPSCGLFAQATVFDLVFPRVLSGERLGAATLAALGHGGLLSRDVAFRFPQYRAALSRGAVE